MSTLHRTESSQTHAAVTLDDVRAAGDRIRSHIHKTPIATSRTLDTLASVPGLPIRLVMKCENLQKIGAFKIRGATNAIISLLSGVSTANSSDLTVITHSSGNHAQALAYASRVLGVSCHVVMPSNSASVKKDAVRGYGAVITECVPTLEAREDTTNCIIAQMKSEGKRIEFIPPYDDVRIIAGQGTLALELIEQADEAGCPLDVLIAPVGGGGMLSGCAVAAKGSNPDIWVVGAEPKGADDAYRSFYAKEFIPSVNPQTIADGLRTSLGAKTFPLILDFVDAIHTVSEEDIIQAMKLVFERSKLVIEPSAAVGLAVALYSVEFKEVLRSLPMRTPKKDFNVGIVFSGGNVDLKELSGLFARMDKF